MLALQGLLRQEHGVSWFQFLVVVWLSPPGKLLFCPSGVQQHTTNNPHDEAEGVPDLVVFSKNHHWRGEIFLAVALHRQSCAPRQCVCMQCLKGSRSRLSQWHGCVCLMSSSYCCSSFDVLVWFGGAGVGIGLLDGVAGPLYRHFYQAVMRDI